jgi:hypothetical protein
MEYHQSYGLLLRFQGSDQSAEGSGPPKLLMVQLKYEVSEREEITIDLLFVMEVVIAIYSCL